MTAIATTEQIFIALLGRLATLGFDINWPNSNFVPVIGEAYLDVQIFPAEPDKVTIDGIHKQFGLFQATLVSPEGIGFLPVIRDAQLVMDAFPNDLTLPAGSSRVRVSKAPYVSTGIQDEAWYRTPITIRYECFTS